MPRAGWRRAGRVCALAIPVWLAVVPGSVWAVGLGEARVESYLNQPLDVEIQLIDVSEEELQALTVRPGDASDYRRVGLDLDQIQTQLEVTLHRDRDPAVVQVTSSEPVGDPVVQILLHARWSSGRVLREYTLFLDPPRVDLAPPPVEQAEPAAEEPRQQQPEPEPEPEDRERTPATPPRQSEAPSQDVAPPETQPAARRAREGSYGPVAAGETLWSIAYEWRPDTSLSMNQVMLAFLQANPEAFADGNVNNLQRGAELAYPDAQDVRAIDVRRAEQEIQAQMQAWQSALGGDVPRISDAAVPEADSPDEPAAPETDERREAAATEPESPEPLSGDTSDGEQVADTGTETGPDGRLQLVPPEDEAGQEGAAEGDLESGAEARRLRAALARAEEELLTSQLENEDLARQVDALREALEAREQGLTVTDTELAELETALRQARESARREARMAESGEDAESDEAFDDYFADLGEDLGVEAGESEQAEEPVPLRDDTDDADGDAASGQASGPDAAGDETETAAQDDAAAGGDETAAAGQDDEATASPDRDDANLRGLGWWLRQPWVWAVIGGVLLIGLVLALVGARRRGDDGEKPSRKEKQVPSWQKKPDKKKHKQKQNEQAESGESELDRARRRVEESPNDLGARVALLALLAEHGEDRPFAHELDEMYARVEHDDDPHWQQALDIARLQTPAHPLVVAAADSDSSDISGESEDDLMRILSEESEETDESPPEIDEARDSDTTRPVAEFGGVDEDDSDPLGLDADLGGRADDDTDAGRGRDTLVLDEDEDGDSDHAGRDTLVLDDPGEASDRRGGDTLVLEDEPGSDEGDLDFDLSAFETASDDSDRDADTDSDPDSDSDSDMPGDAPLEWNLTGEDLPEADGGKSDDAAAEPDVDIAGPADAETAGDASVGDDDALFDLGEDEAEVKLDLARAYISMGDRDAARTILEEVAAEGNAQQKETARKMLDDEGS